QPQKVPQLPYHSFGRHPRNPNFFGRQDITEKLDGFLLPSQAAGGPGARSAAMGITKSCAICGIGGMGKTQIALEYEHSRRSEFDAIMLVQADARTSISASFGTIAVALGLAGESESSDLAVSFSIAMQWLSNPVKPAVTARSTLTPPPERADNALVEATWLVIFHNADTIDLLSEFWPSSASTGSVLITTRDPAGRDFCLDNGIMLQPLSVEDAVRFFVEQLNLDSDGHTRFDSESDVGSFVERFGGLPLALVQDASLIRRRQMTVDEFSQLSRRGLKPTGLANYQASQSDGGYQHSIFTVWTFETLEEATKSLLNVMSLMDPFAIQEAILQPQEENTHQLAGSVPSPYPTDIRAYVAARSELVKAFLISRSLPSRHVELHPLVQEVVWAGMDEEQLRTHFCTAVALIHAAWPSEVVK
ncbi:P-loop containing nucleoside triphosphate hydrolase protein, partial [Lasiosphaeria ovina]